MDLLINRTLYMSCQTGPGFEPRKTMQKGEYIFQFHKIKMNVYYVKNNDFLLSLCNQSVNIVEHKAYFRVS